MNPMVKDLLKVGLPVLLAVVAYLLQVDPMSLCPKTGTTEVVRVPQQPDGGP